MLQPGRPHERRTSLQDRWSQRRSTLAQAGIAQASLCQLPKLPEPIGEGAFKLCSATLEEVPNGEALARWLRERGLETEEWGKGKSKDVGKLWKELKLEECQLELWRTSKGEVRTVRVVHVLRAKVCSPQSYERGIFLFNSWQQFGSGSTRTRNGLLSEKLSPSELPLENHLHEVCKRAVTQEEMQRVDGAAFRVGPGYASPEYDPDYVCPITVADQQYVDHNIEIEHSASYPGLLTMYHLYTVEIVCLGLPTVDFTTLEFEAPDENGHRKLKYVHAWVWLEWAQIQRYLFEGSKLKDRKMKGSFKDSADLTLWLSQFHLELSEWSKDTWKSVDDLFKQVESGETQLEHWGRHDGVALLMRVVHVVQLEVRSNDSRLMGRFLLQTWQQNRHASRRPVNRLITKTLSTLDLPFDDQRLKDAAARTVQEKLGYIVGPHFQLDSSTHPTLAKLQPSSVEVVKAHLMDHHVSVDESPSYKGMCTLYHLYNMHVVCTGLPVADFASVTFEPCCCPAQSPAEPRVRVCQGFRWVTWPRCVDIWQARTAAIQRQQAVIQAICKQQEQLIGSSNQAVLGLTKALKRLAEKTSPEDPDLLECECLLGELQVGIEDVAALEEQARERAGFTETLPPSMVSEMSESTILSQDTWETAMRRRIQLTRKLSNIFEELDDEACQQSSPGGTPVNHSRSSSKSVHRVLSGESPSPKAAMVAQVFSQADQEGCGTISEEGLAEVFRSLNPELTQESIQSVLAAANSNKGGTVRYKDFISWLYRECNDRGEP